MLDFFEDDQDAELDPSQNLVHHPQQVWGEVRMHASVWYAMYLVSVPFVWWMCCVDDGSAVCKVNAHHLCDCRVYAVCTEPTVCECVVFGGLALSSQ